MVIVSEYAWADLVALCAAKILAERANVMVSPVAVKPG